MDIIYAFFCDVCFPSILMATIAKVIMRVVVIYSVMLLFVRMKHSCCFMTLNALRPKTVAAVL